MKVSLKNFSVRRISRGKHSEERGRDLRERELLLQRGKQGPNKFPGKKIRGREANDRGRIRPRVVQASTNLQEKGQKGARRISKEVRGS